jgi:hypothetical protein
MPLVYQSSLAAQGNSTTSGTPNTEVDLFFLKAGVATAFFQALQLQGKSSLLSQISGLAVRMIKWGTASTGGTGVVPSNNDPGAQAATATAASLPASGTTRTNRMVIGCGTTTPGQWVARDYDSTIKLQGGGAPSIDGMDVSGAASLPFEWSFEHWE